MLADLAAALQGLGMGAALVIALYAIVFLISYREFDGLARVAWAVILGCLALIVVLVRSVSNA